MGKSTIKVLAFLEKPIGRDVYKFLLLNKNIEIVAIITNHSQNNWWRDNSIWSDATNTNKTLTFPSERRLNSAELDVITSLEYDLVLSVQYRWKIPKILYEGKRFTANIHFSPLPYYRGHHTFFHAILDNSRFFGITLHELEDEFDTGKIIDQKLFLVEESETAESLYEKCVELGRKSVFLYVDNLVQGREIFGISQVKGGSFFAKDELENRVMKMRKSPESNQNLRQALHFPPVIDFLKEKFKSDPSKLEFLI
jgi:methionyl-tRNA formyltransferase